MWAEIAAIYKASKKKKDINWYTEWVARPPAAAVVYFLRRTPITPNQVTFLSALIAAGACAMLVLLPGSYLWLLVAAAVFELSFVLDCADGQLARYRKIASPLGHLLDFLMDELKAMMLFASVAARLWQETGDARLLAVGLGGLFCLAAGLTLTSFTRRPEYGTAKAWTEDGQPAQVGGRKGLAGLVLTPIEFAARVVVHYPQYLWLVALLDRMDVYFWAYAGVNALYFAKTSASVFLRLGRFTPQAPPAPRAPEAPKAAT
jgi:phosphatidylglycerophosphate synthase